MGDFYQPLEPTFLVVIQMGQVWKRHRDGEEVVIVGIHRSLGKILIYHPSREQTDEIITLGELMDNYFLTRERKSQRNLTPEQIDATLAALLSSNSCDSCRAQVLQHHRDDHRCDMNSMLFGGTRTNRPCQCQDCLFEEIFGRDDLNGSERVRRALESFRESHRSNQD